MAEENGTQDARARLLRSIDVGSPIAEHDQLLADARIETPIFEELARDRVDIVKGTKGSGKTALFKIFTDLLANVMMEKQGVLLVRGIDNVRDPVFAQYRPALEDLDLVTFENFWRMYIISVINNSIFFSEEFSSSPLRSAKKEMDAYRQCCARHGYPTPRGLTLQTIVTWVISKLPRAGLKRIKIGVAPDPASGAPQGSIEIEREEPVPPPAVAVQPVPVFIQEVQEALIRVLTAADLRLWVMLDRLDEVFERRSDFERVALTALLRTALSFTSERIRLKIFLRDDIFESVTETNVGFVNLSHLLGRASGTLSWTKEQLLHLVVRRIFSNSHVRQYYGVNASRLGTDSRYREEMFYRVFPEKIHAGENQSRTLDWLMKHCEDANGVVTPRDFIDLVTFAVREEKEVLRQGSMETSLLSAGSIRAGYKRLCQQKKVGYLQAEFPHFWPDIEKFEGRKATHSEESLERILGRTWNEKAKRLRAIGFFHYNARLRTYQVPYVYRQCLGIRQGREGDR